MEYRGAKTPNLKQRQGDEAAIVTAKESNVNDQIVPPPPSPPHTRPPWLCFPQANTPSENSRPTQTTIGSSWRHYPQASSSPNVTVVLTRRHGGPTRCFRIIDRRKSLHLPWSVARGGHIKSGATARYTSDTRSQASHSWRMRPALMEFLQRTEERDNLNHTAP